MKANEKWMKRTLVTVIFLLTLVFSVPAMANVSGGGSSGFSYVNGAWSYVENGKVNTRKNDIIFGKVNGVTGWWYVTGGKVNYSKTVAGNANGWWYVHDGKVDFSYTGPATNANGTWFIKEGKVYYPFTGFAASPYGWYDVQNGKILTGESGVLYKTVNGQSGWWYIQAGHVDTTETVAWNPNGWWYVHDGKVDFSYTGPASNANGTWYIKNGKVDVTYTGYARRGRTIWYFENGKGISYTVSAYGGDSQNVIDAAAVTPSTGAGYCAEWVTNVFANSGLDIIQYGNACDMYSQWCTSNDLSELKPGMIIAVDKHDLTDLGLIYGHVGIYIGDGLVMDNIGEIRTMSVYDWIEDYSNLSEVRWGWLGGVELY